MSLQPMWDSEQRKETATPVTAHTPGDTLSVWTRMSQAAALTVAQTTGGSAENSAERSSKDSSSALTATVNLLAQFQQGTNEAGRLSTNVTSTNN